jgi:hypothetical protein
MTKKSILFILFSLLVTGIVVYVLAMFVDLSTADIIGLILAALATDVFLYKKYIQQKKLNDKV